MIPLANDDVYNLTAYYYNSEENLESNIVVAIIVLFGCVVYAVEIVLGIPANIFVLVKMVVFTRSTHDNMARSAAPGTCLLAMAIADIVSLTAILCHCLLNANLLQIDDTFHSLVCKLAIFSTHVATSISIWSWLLMSILRYISLYKPFWRYRAWYKPQRTLITIVILCSLLNIWLIPCVIYSSHQGCSQTRLFNDLAVNKALLLTEIGWSFVVPIAVISFLDTSALCTVPRIVQHRMKETVLSMAHNACSIKSEKYHKKSRKTLLRWLIIALIDIGLNTPENLHRIGTILDIITEDEIRTNTYVILRTISEVMYYSQFSFNAVYLALFIYDRCTSLPPNKRSNCKCTCLKPVLLNADPKPLPSFRTSYAKCALQKVNSSAINIRELGYNDRAPLKSLQSLSATNVNSSTYPPILTTTLLRTYGTQDSHTSL